MSCGSQTPEVYRTRHTEQVWPLLMADPWVVTPGERTKHEEQFNTLRPANGFITGEQAKGFFLQSRLPPPVLGIIWSLSDINGDGKMDLHEFSIACKLINLKLRGFNLPQTLPVSLKQSACGGPATTVPGVGSTTPQSIAATGTETSAARFISADPIIAAPAALAAGSVALGSGPSVTSAIAPGPVVSPVVMAGSLPPNCTLPSYSPDSIPASSLNFASSVSSMPMTSGLAEQNLANIVPQSCVPGVMPPSGMPCLDSGGLMSSGPGSVLVMLPVAAGMNSLPASLPTSPRAVPLPGLTGQQAPIPSVVSAPVVPMSVAPAAMASAPMVPQAVPMVPASMPMASASMPMTSVAASMAQTTAPMVPASMVSATMVPGQQPVETESFKYLESHVSRNGRVDAEVGGVGQIPSVPIGSTAPPVGTATPPSAAMQRTASQESGGSMTPVEWAIPQASKLKFTQVFNMTDRTKSGYLSGVQARNILIQSQLPQQALAQIWVLADVDNDGRLSCEEFVLAMYLCESAKAGNKIPLALPPELIPPTHRRQRTSSVQSGGSGGTPVSDVIGGAVSDNSFEDRRRENFEKGQAELERRRKALLDAQRRETEERLRREREEEAKREKARLEAERRRQEELEREMQRQRELEAQKEQERKRQEELKEQARKDAEFQRQQEWEKQRLQELMNVRQRQQENLLSLKAKNQSLSIELSTKEDRVKELTQKISATRQGVTEVKATIDTMRSTRDTYMSEMNQLKASARDQNQRLLALNQEKARLKARNAAVAGASGAEQAAVDASLTSKQMVIKQLQEKVDDLEKELSTKEEDVNNNITDLSQLKEDMKATAERCSEVYVEYSSKRLEVVRLREKLVNPDAAWGDSASSAWAEETSGSNVVASAGGGAMRYRALYQFDARNHDELSFMPGDVITITVTEGAEPGWVGGELRGQTGWFPEAYCERIEDKAAPEAAVTEVVRTQLENIPEESTAAPALQQKSIGEAVGIFPWRAKQNNHLSFNKGDRITVREQQDQWWYGQLNNVGGWFPHSFVRMVSGPAAVTSPVTTPQEAPEEPPMPENLIHDEVSEFYHALYPYQSGEPGDLAFNAGEIILVVKKDGDWWHGIINQNVGIFPSNYVELLPDQFITVTVEDNQIGQVAIPAEEDFEVINAESLVKEESLAEQQAVIAAEENEEWHNEFTVFTLILVNRDRCIITGRVLVSGGDGPTIDLRQGDVRAFSLSSPASVHLCLPLNT
ncbi:Intersectin 1 (SH3 domain protein) [Halocaridina rubra]|uniref:Intersectin 1 (SH3 domain protein) n=1 Tax=Halocaridina rubra TaxID=373956 RepID=A0AAN8WLU6_HALRR